MKLLIVRHGDPDYSIDSLTEVGRKEAEFLAERLAAVETAAYYVSPLGRAKDTAAPTLQRVGREALECPWLREFRAPIRRPDRPEQESVCWDWLPQDWAGEPRFYLPGRWHEPEIFRAAGVKEQYDWVTTQFDALLEHHGYKREGNLYRALRPSSDTLVFFCHFGVECVLLSHLLNASPMVLWHGTCAAPSSVTTVATEERRPGIASFRITAFGDTSHLYVHGQSPAFSARFRECHANEDERRD